MAGRHIQGLYRSTQQYGVESLSLVGTLAVAIVAVLIVVFLAPPASATPIQSLSTGTAHACAVREGIVKCWGNNASGQLGNNSRTNSSTPSPLYTRAAYTENTRECTGWEVLGACVGGSWRDKVTNHPATPLHGESVTKVSAGQHHTCAIASARAYCWGEGGSGSLGNNSATDSSLPVSVSTEGALKNKELIDISAGDGFTCALASDGTVACWGRNNNGQLGTGNRTDSRVPVAVSRGEYVPSIPAHCSGTPNPVIGCAGNVRWIEEVPAIPASALQDKKVKKLADLKGDTATMCAITTEDRAICWGQNDFGEVGNGRTILTRATKSTGKGHHTSKSRCHVTDKDAKSDAMSNIRLDNTDVLRPAAVSTSLKFDSIDIVAGGGGIDSLESGDTKTYVYVTANTTSSSVDPNKAFYWGGALSYTLDVKCVVNHDYNDHGGKGGRAESTDSTATLELLLFGTSTPKGPLYVSTQSSQLRGQQLALIAGDASIGSNYVQQCATRTEQFWFTTRDVTVCDSPRSGLACAVTTVSQGTVFCDTGAQTCTDNSNGTQLHITILKAAGTYRQTCSMDSPRAISFDNTSWTQTDASIDGLDSGFGGFACAVIDSSVGCWGEGSKGQLGNGATKTSALPVKVRL